jgi:uncharacterized protein YcbK (DUF882 family)
LLSRRNFIKTATALVADSFLTPNVLAEDFRSNLNDPYKKQYQYTPESGANPFNPIKETGNINLLPMDQHQQRNFWDNPRKIFVKRVDTNETAQLLYFADGKLNTDGYNGASYLLRDIHANKMIGMDVKLLDLICAVQAWLNYYGVKSPIMIHSGYRTLKTNGSLEGAAKNSMHLYGRAMDFSVPGLSPVILAKIAAQFKAGGIGIYPSRNFIHLDTGGVRMWVK